MEIVAVLLRRPQVALPFYSEVLDLVSKTVVDHEI